MGIIHIDATVPPVRWQGPTQVWHVDRSEEQPDWTHFAGDLDLDIQCIRDGEHWLVLEEGAEHCMLLDQEQFDEWKSQETEQ